LVTAGIEGDEGVDEGEEEGDDNPCDGCTRGDGPGVPFVKAVCDLFPPVIVIRYGIEEILILGELESGLLKGYQCLRKVDLFLEFCVFHPSIDRSGI
jgi:hypothetical protein